MRDHIGAIAICLSAALVASGCAGLLGCGGGGVPSQAGGTQMEDAGAASVPTEVRGVKKSLSGTRDQQLSDEVTVSPAWGRTVELQYLDPATDQWQTVSSCQTDDAEKAEVTLDYGESWKSHARSTWRVHVPAAQLQPRASGQDGGSAATENAAECEKGVTVSLSDPALSCKSAVVMDAETGKVVFDSDAKKKLKIASTTKMISAILLVENKDLSDPVKITAETAKTPWGLGLVKGDTVSAKDLLYGMMLPSANDAATAAGIAVSGSTAAFVERMNERAAELGCTDTVYRNANGLDKKGAHSTALDQAKIARHIMTDPGLSDIRTAVRTWKKSFKSKKGVKYRLENTDNLLKAKGRYRALGVKTGSTDKAGCCFAGAFEVGGRTVITVELGAKTADERWSTTRELVDIASYAQKHGLEGYDL